MMKLLVLLVACLGIDIDSAWLNARSEPYMLDQADSTYVLKTDVKTFGTAFVDGNFNINLDLNGHTVTFGDADALQLVNGDFEEGNPQDGANVPGWDLSKCTAPTIAPARVGMWGNQMLSIPKYNTPQVLLSDPIFIPVGGKEYAGVITAKGSSGVVAVVDVINTAGESLGSANVTLSRGHGGVAMFSLPLPGKVRLRFSLTPPAIDPAVNPPKFYSADIDGAAILASRDFGIVASKASTSQLPIQLKSSMVLAKGRAANFKVYNGKIIQGKGKTIGAQALYLRSIVGASVDRVDSLMLGMDSLNIDSVYASNVAVTNCRLESNVNMISDRFRLFAAIRSWSNKGDVLIANNSVVNCPQLGFSITSNVDGKVRILNNSVVQKAVVSNGYGISVRGLNNFEVAGNTIVTRQGRGIILEGGGTPISNNGNIHDNYVDVREGPNLEYSNDVMDVLALRIRNYEQTLSNMRIHDNQFIATTDDSGLEAAIGMRIMHENSNGQLDNSNNRIENNLFRAVSNSIRADRRAWAVSISGVEAGTGLVLANNIFETNDISMKIGDQFSSNINNSDFLLLGNTFRKLDVVGFSRPYASIEAGDQKGMCSSIRIIDSKYEGGATDAVVFKGTLHKDLSFGETKIIINKTLVNP